MGCDVPDSRGESEYRVPGSVVTIKGRLCFSDDFDLAGLDAEDRKSVIEAGDDELRIPGLATVNQVSFG